MSLKFSADELEIVFPRASRFAVYEDITAYFQGVFDKWLSSQPVVYSAMEQPYETWLPIRPSFSRKTARLVCIEPIKKCDHEAEKVKQDIERENSYYVQIAIKKGPSESAKAER